MNKMPAQMTQMVEVYLETFIDAITQRPKTWCFCIDRGSDSDPIHLSLTDAEMCNFISNLKNISPFDTVKIIASKDKFEVIRGDREPLITKQPENPMINENTVVVTIPARSIMGEYYAELNRLDDQEYEEALDKLKMYNMREA